VTRNGGLALIPGKDNLKRSYKLIRLHTLSMAKLPHLDSKILSENLLEAIHCSSNCRIMSLFKTLQNSPATITLFHNKKVPQLVLLYSILEKLSRKLNADRTKFQIDLMENKMPTFDQFKFLINSCISDDASTETVKRCYPLVTPRKTSSEKEKKSVTIAPPLALQNRNFKTFREGEYAMIYDAFNQLVEDAHAHPEHDPSEIFRAPLVVDWDQCLVAGDEATLEQILAKYE
jgi:hypothetical protein